MKTLMTVLLVSSPAAAQAMGMHGGGCGGGPKCCVHLAIAIYAVLAVLGYWVMQRADKESGSLVKKTGGVIAWVLIIVGLLGVLCGVGAHIKGAMPHQCGGNCPHEMMGNGPEGENEDMNGPAVQAPASKMVKGGAKPSCPMHMQKGKTK
jgi:hypothetical protein